MDKFSLIILLAIGVLAGIVVKLLRDRVQKRRRLARDERRRQRVLHWELLHNTRSRKD